MSIARRTAIVGLLGAVASIACGCVPMIGPEDYQSQLMFTPDGQSVISIREKSVAIGMFMAENVFGLVPYDFEVRIIPVDGGETRTIHVRGLAPDNGLVNLEEARFSPSGRRLALLGACGTAVVDLDAATHQWLDPPGQWITDIVWLSEGEVAYIAGRTPAFMIRGTRDPHLVYRHKVFDADAGREPVADRSTITRSLGTIKGGGRGERWRAHSSDLSDRVMKNRIDALLGPDANYVVEATDCEGWLCLYVYDKGGYYFDRDVRHVIPTPPGPGGEDLGWATLSPDGRHVAGLGERGEVLIAPIDLLRD